MSARSEESVVDYPPTYGQVPPDAPSGLADLLGSARAAIKKNLALAFVGGVLKVIPYIALVEIARTLLADGPAPWGWVIAAIICLVVGSYSYFAALGSGHREEALLRHRLRLNLVDKLGRVALGWFTQSSSGKIRQAVAKDTTQIHTIVAHLGGDVGHCAGMIVASLIYLLIINPAFILGLFIFYIVVMGVSYGIFARGLAEVFTGFQQSERDLSTATVEMVDGIAEVKNFGMTEEVFGRFDRARERFSSLSYRWSKKQGTFYSIVLGLMQPATLFATVLAFGVPLVNAGWMEPVDVLAFAVVWVSVPESLLSLLMISNELYFANRAAESTVAIMAAPELVSSGQGTRSDSAPAVELVDVSFSYDGDDRVLSHVSLTCQPGTVTALVGPSGGGKSTLARLIARFWDVEEGQVKVEGADVRDLSATELMSRLSLVFQDVRLTHGTVADNIALGRPGASRDEIVAAAKAAIIHDRIERLEHGYDTMLGEGQGVLSGGEAQRLTIARAFLAAAPILILDEATAQADAHAEREIQQAISRLAVGRTVIVIAHRLSTIRGVDQIAVVEGGEVHEVGTHEELLARGGTYARMWELQDRESPTSPDPANSSLTNSPDTPVSAGEPGSAGGPEAAGTPDSAGALQTRMSESGEGDHHAAQI
ncbi:MAG: ABC transporter ATP-binding protein [Flaviflexus sp.]|nr:ABC transporter ATP-binding protein [Flaviflexus sp.]